MLGVQRLSGLKASFLYLETPSQSISTMWEMADEFAVGMELLAVSR
jgi:hypothetical protein